MDVLSDVVAAMRTGRPHSGQQRLQAPWRLRAQPFAGAGFHVVLQGSCWLVPERDDPVPLGAGDVAFLPHGSAHGLTDTVAPADTASGTGVDLRLERDGLLTGDVVPVDATSLLCGAYLLDQARPHPLLTELPDVIRIPARVGSHPALRAALDLLGTELESPRPGRDAVVPALLDMLLLFILRAWYDEQPHDHNAGWAAALTDPGISAALRAMHLEPQRQWTVNALAKVAGLSRAPFAHRFTTLAGQPPLRYLTWWRMTTAARLLRDDDAPVRVVGEKVGYTSEFAFAKAFRREYGIAPGRYRRQAPAGDGP